MEPTSTFLAAALCYAALNRSPFGDRHAVPEDPVRHAAGLMPPAPPEVRVGAPPASYIARSETIRELREIANLALGWDGEDGELPSGMALAAAEHFIQMLPARFETPEVSLASDGELGYFWKGEGYFIDLSFDEKGLMTYFARNHTRKGGEEDVRLGNAFPPELLHFLPVKDMSLAA